MTDIPGRGVGDVCWFRRYRAHLCKQGLLLLPADVQCYDFHFHFKKIECLFYWQSNLFNIYKSMKHRNALTEAQRSVTLSYLLPTFASCIAVISSWCAHRHTTLSPYMAVTTQKWWSWSQVVWWIWCICWPSFGFIHAARRRLHSLKVSFYTHRQITANMEALFCHFCHFLLVDESNWSNEWHVRTYCAKFTH